MQRWRVLSGLQWDQYTDLYGFCRPDKAFTPHPATGAKCRMQRWRVLSGL